MTTPSPITDEARKAEAYDAYWKTRQESDYRKEAFREVFYAGINSLDSTTAELCAKLGIAVTAAELRHVILRWCGYEGPPILTKTDIAPFELKCVAELRAQVDTLTKAQERMTCPNCDKLRLELGEIRSQVEILTKERDEARHRVDVLCWNEGKCEGIAKGVLKPFEFAPEGMEPPHPVLHAAKAVSEIVQVRDSLRAQLATIQAYLSQPDGTPFFAGALLEQVQESLRELQRERKELEAQLAAVSAERDEAKQGWYYETGKLEVMKSQRDSALAENSALREALEETLSALLASTDDDHTIRNARYAAIKKARAALATKGAGE